MKKMFLLTLAISLIVSSVAFAGSGGGKLLFVQTYQTGGSSGVFIETETRNNDQGCTHPGFFIPFSDENVNSKLALLLSAQALNRDVIIWGDNICDDSTLNREGVTLIHVGSN